MTDRITSRDLDGVLMRINLTFGEEPAGYTREADGRFHANVGTFVIDGAYGGWELQRMMNEGGGVSDVLGTGHVSRRELYHQLHAFLRGIEAWERHLEEVSEDA